MVVSLQNFLIIRITVIRLSNDRPLLILDSRRRKNTVIRCSILTAIFVYGKFLKHKFSIVNFQLGSDFMVFEDIFHDLL